MKFPESITFITDEVSQELPVITEFIREFRLPGIELRSFGGRAFKDLTPADLLSDALVFGLRLNAGVDPAALAARFATDLPPAVDTLFRDLAAEGLLEADGRTIRLTGEGRMRADAVGVAILDRFD